MTAQPVLTEEELAALVAGAMPASWLDLSRGPPPAVLDTDFIRTGLHYQLRNSIPPRSVRAAAGITPHVHGVRHADRDSGEAAEVRWPAECSGSGPAAGTE